MTVLSVVRHGPNAAVWGSLAPEGCTPDEIQVSVYLTDPGRYRGRIVCLYYGINRKTGERNSRRTACEWKFAEHNIPLFTDGDVRALLRARECR